MKLKTLHLNLDLIESLKEFSNKTYKKGYFLSDIKYVNWWFQDNPHNTNSKKNQSMVAVVKNKIIGFQGRIPTTLRYEQQKVPAHWWCNMMVLPQYRNTGVGPLLAKACLEEFPDSACIGYNSGANAILDRLGFNLFGHKKLRRAIYTAEPSVLKSLMVSDDTIKTLKSVSFSNLVKKKLDIERINTIDNDFDDLWERVHFRYGLTCDRTSKHLKWRFLYHPTIDYHVLSTVGSRNAVAVLRFEGNPKEFGFVARIVDFYCEKEVAAAFLKAVVEYAQTRNVIMIDFYCSKAIDLEAFKQNSFHWLKAPECIPYLFNPLEKREIWEECFGIHLLCLKEFKKFVYEDVYFVKADGDRDR